MQHADRLIDRVRDSERKQRFEEAYQQAEVPLTETVTSGHSFVFDQSRQHLEVSRQRIEALLEQLANPPNR